MQTVKTLNRRRILRRLSGSALFAHVPLRGGDDVYVGGGGGGRYSGLIW